MADEVGKKRSMVTLGSDSGRLREGDDIPKTDADAPVVPSQSPTPLSLGAVSRYLRELTTTPPGAKGNAYPLTETLSVVKTHNPDGTTASLVTPSRGVANVFAANFGPEIVLSMAGQMFDKETIEKIRAPKTGYHELLRSIVRHKTGRNPEAETPE